MAQNIVSETYVIIAQTNPGHADNKAFMAARFPPGNPLGYVWVADDSARKITLTRAGWLWEPPPTP